MSSPSVKRFAPVLAGLAGLSLAASYALRALPVPLLRIIPLIFTTVNLCSAISCYHYLSQWTVPVYREKANALLPAWFTNWIPGSAITIVTGFSLGIGGGVANLSMAESGPASLALGVGAQWWYRLALFFTIAHLLFAPWALELLDATADGKGEGGACRQLEKWLYMHVWRMAVSDVPAFVCCVIAVVEGLNGV